ncbi:MAG: hypothetical protein ACYDGR_05425 [Candidatus Dormibacteria bacterium]
MRSASAILIVVGLLAACGSSPSGTAAPTPSPVTASAVARELYDHLSAGETTAASALIAADATWDGGPGCSPAKCVGLAAIQKSFGIKVGGHGHYSLSDFAESGSTVTFKNAVTSDLTRAAAVSRILVKQSLTIGDGKVVAVTEALDATDPETLTFIKFRNAHPAPSASPTR